MRDYGTVSAKFWIGNTGKILRGDCQAQVLALYLITSPHSSMSGLYYCPTTYMAQDTGIPLEGASKALRKLINVGFCEYDEKMEMIFVIRMAQYQIGGNLSTKDKRRIGLIKELKKIPNTVLLKSFLKEYSELFNLNPAEFGVDIHSPFEGAQMPLLSQDQDQDQDQEQDRELGRRREPPPPQQPDFKDRVPPEGSSYRLKTIYAAMQNVDFNVPGVGDQTMWDNVTKPRKVAENLDKSAPAIDIPKLITKLAGWTYANPKKAKKDLGRFVWNAAIKDQDIPRPTGHNGDDYAHGSDLAAKVNKAKQGGGR